MKERRGKRVAWWIVGLGLCAIFVCAVVFKDRIMAEWWLQKLESGDTEEQRAAAGKLGSLGCVRAIPAILKLLRHKKRNGEYLWYAGPLAASEGKVIHLSDLPPGSGSFTRVCFPVAPGEGHLLNALWRITTIRTKEVVPRLVRALKDDDGYIRRLALLLLVKAGSDAKSAVPAISELLYRERAANSRNYSETERDIAFHAMLEISAGGNDYGVISLLTSLARDQDPYVRRAAEEALSFYREHLEQERRHPPRRRRSPEEDPTP